MSLTRSPPAGLAIVIGSPSNVVPSHHEPSAFWIELDLLGERRIEDVELDHDVGDRARDREQQDDEPR